MNILTRIVAATRLRVERDKADCPMEALRERVQPVNVPFQFEKALARPGVSFICEVKKASPSKGVIAEDFPYVEIARQYCKAGADAISVLTEPDFFLGKDAYLHEIRRAVSTPLLRKDFVVDPYQIVQAAALGADAVLLICAILSAGQLRDLIALADSFGLSALVETREEEELTMAKQAGARVIGVNNRDLRSFAVDTDRSLRMRALVGGDVLFVSESGISSAQDIAVLEKNGVDAVLIGEALMRAPDKTAALAALRAGVQ